MAHDVNSKEARLLVGSSSRADKRWRDGIHAAKKRPAQPEHRVRAGRGKQDTHAVVPPAALKQDQMIFPNGVRS